MYTDEELKMMIDILVEYENIAGISEYKGTKTYDCGKSIETYDERKKALGHVIKVKILTEKTKEELFNEIRNIKRDKRGRLNEGAKLAKKDNCNSEEIWKLHKEGKSVEEIVKLRKCSKSTVYKVIKRCEDTRKILWDKLK